MTNKIRFVEISEDVTLENFNEERYLKENPDIKKAVENGTIKSGLYHFKRHGRREHRKQRAEKDFKQAILEIREKKIIRIKDCLKEKKQINLTNDLVYDFLDEKERTTLSSCEIENASSFFYDEIPLKIINELPDGLILDCGAGYRPVYYENVVNYEIFPYPSTDVLGFAEKLPFSDNSFDAVFSFAVLEHVKYPFQVAKEMTRVLKPGGKFLVSAAFLQPLHAYPHHYFNMTQHGLKTLFEDDIEIDNQFLTDSTGAIGSLTWLIKHWVHNLPLKEKKKFSRMRIGDFLGEADEYLNESFVTKLSKEVQFELACTTMLQGTKK